MKTNIEKFIKEHNHICYCEAVIYPDGDVEYCIPSHQEKLIEISGKSKEELMKEIPMAAAVNEWLSDKYNITLLWYNYIILPRNYSEQQIKSIQKLMKASVLYNNITAIITDEVDRSISAEYAITHGRQCMFISDKEAKIIDEE